MDTLFFCFFFYFSLHNFFLYNIVYENIFHGYLKTEVPELIDAQSGFAKDIVQSTTDVYQRVLDKLRPTPKKSHYTFNTRDVSNVFRGMLMVNRNRLWDREKSKIAKMFDNEEETEGKGEEKAGSSSTKENKFPVRDVSRTVLRLWLHEQCRVIYDRLIDDNDQIWFSNLCSEITNINFPLMNCFNEGTWCFLNYCVLVFIKYIYIHVNLTYI